MFRFAGFELDQQRAELRGPDSGSVKLRPKTFDILVLFAANPGRILSKQELMDAVWPNVHVGEDSLFQCIRELRAALGDDQRQMVKLVSGRGYIFDAEVLAEPVRVQEKNQPDRSAPVIKADTAADAASAPSLGMRLRGPVAAVLGLVAIVGLAVATPLFRSGAPPKRTPVVAVMPVAEVSQDAQTAAMAANVTDRLADGLAKIDNIQVVAPSARSKGASPAPASAPAAEAEADFVVTSELFRGQASWTLRTRMIKTATGQVEAIPAVTIDEKDLDPDLQQSRLAAGVGHLLALRINALLDAEGGAAGADGSSPSTSAKVAIEQANASIVQTSRERFTAAQSMLEKSLADDPNNADLQVALAALQLRGVQMVWYSPADSAAAEKSAKSLLERAVRTKPTSIPVQEAYCRFLNATNEFVESLVACARTLAFDPWNGLVLYHMGVAHIQLGRFEDAIATFNQAYRFDTPQVSRWTWLLGVGWSYVMMGRDADALPWLEKSIAITPASGRPLMLLATVYHRLGREKEAKAALARALEIRPGSTASNVRLPTKNASSAYLSASDKIVDALVEIGLPTH